MQNLNTFNNTGLSLELFHVQTNTSFELPLNLAVFNLGKPNEQIPPDIDISSLPDADVVSRIHAQIQIHQDSYFIQDLGSSNGTFLNKTRLESNIPYQLNLGDTLELGQGGKVTFIFQNKPQNQQSQLSTSNPTTFQSPITANSRHSVNKTSKLAGSALMLAAIVILASSIQVGVFFRIPGLLLCIAGVFLFFQRRINPNLGWVLIALGIIVIAFTGNVFASVNFLVFLASSALFFAGYQLFDSGKILNYDLRSLQSLVKK